MYLVYRCDWSSGTNHLKNAVFIQHLMTGYMKESVSKLTNPMLQHCLSKSKHQWRAIGQKLVSSELHKIMLVKVQKGYKLLLKKDQISISCKNAYQHIMSLITTKFHEILLIGFSGVANCFNIIFNFGQFLSSKRGITPRKKKIESEFPVNMHIYTFSPS